ncbi:hypothetical protein EV424DRAFT_1346041 [Suillus variegatus]|nr:hypothetical protein EV424DRAFT_1346041 [Suillus variegatus]
MLITNLSSFQAKAINKPLVDVNVTQQHAPKIEGVRRIPPGFFDDHVNSSTSRGHRTAAPRQSMQPSRFTSYNLLSLAQNFISGMLRRRDRSAIQLPPVVEVPLTAGKPRNYHARKKPSTSSSQPPKPPTTQQHNGGATQSNLSSSQQPNTTATASTTSPAVTGTVAAAGTSHPDITIKRAGWQARFLLWVCYSIHYGHLTKAVSALSTSYPDVRAFVHDVTQKVFLLVGDAARIVISLPKQILLAND